MIHVVVLGFIAVVTFIGVVLGFRLARWLIDG